MAKLMKQCDDLSLSSADRERQIARNNDTMIKSELTQLRGKNSAATVQDSASKTLDYHSLFDLNLHGNKLAIKF